MGLRSRLSQLRSATQPKCSTGCIATIGIGHMVSLKANTPISRLGLAENEPAEAPQPGEDKPCAGQIQNI